VEARDTGRREALWEVSWLEALDEAPSTAARLDHRQISLLAALRPGRPMPTRSHGFQPPKLVPFRADWTRCVITFPAFGGMESAISPSRSGTHWQERG
jgi:hypothetical protein